MPDPDRVAEVQAICTRHAELETRGDLEATMATLVDEPRYDLLPVGWTLEGTDQVRRYYEHLIGSFIPATRDYQLLEEWANETSVAQEYVIHVEVDGVVESHHVVGVLWVIGDLLGGERIYASERCLRLMAGDDLVGEISRR